MRIIKFRVWDKLNHQMMTGGKNSSVFSIVEDSPDNFIPMQFTGLLDKNGKEIYEGDIVLLPNEDYEPDNGLSPTLVGELFYFESGYAINLEDSVLTQIEEYKMEVIGNIYENPALVSS